MTRHGEFLQEGEEGTRILLALGQDGYFSAMDAVQRAMQLHVDVVVEKPHRAVAEYHHRAAAMKAARGKKASVMRGQVGNLAIGWAIAIGERAHRTGEIIPAGSAESLGQFPTQPHSNDAAGALTFTVRTNQPALAADAIVDIAFDTDQNPLTSGTVLRISGDALHLRYDTPEAGRRAPVIGDLAVKVH